MRTIAVVSRKGGSGKTTISVQLALSLHARGLGVIVADTDPQRSSFEALKSAVDERLQVLPTTAGKLAPLKAACGRTTTDVLIIDTPAVLADEIAAAVGQADLALLISRPTFIDLSAAVATAQQIKQLRKPGLVLLNQAPPSRQGVELPSTLRALRAAELLGLEVCPFLVRTRACYQLLLEESASIEVQRASLAARAETAALVSFIQHRLGVALGMHAAALNAGSAHNA